jgi:hypothetical protein
MLHSEPVFLDANLFMMYAMAIFQMKLEQTKAYMAPLIISSGSMFDLNQLLNLISKFITSPKLLAHYLTTSPEMN